MNKIRNKQKNSKSLRTPPSAMNPWATNLSQTPIAITEDKLRLILLESADSLRSRRNWIAPFSIIISCIVVLTTTEKFKNYFGIDMKTVFMLELILSISWLLYELYHLYINWSKGSIDCIVKNIMNKPAKTKKKVQYK